MLHNFKTLFLWLITLTAFSQTTAPLKYEFRGLWVTTAFNLDWPSSNQLSPEEQKKEFITLLNKHKSLGINTVIVQVRAAADAFYESDYEPWSVWLTGEQGKKPKPYWDPLAFMTEECHKRGMEIHAWFNLFRAVSHERFFKPDRHHVSRKHPEWTYKIGEKIFFNPGEPELREYLTKVVLDCVQKYDIDGVHLDDYFYPQEIKGDRIDDEKTFKEYGKNFNDLAAWRRDNINQIIKMLSDSIHAKKTYIKFGISPVCVWRHKHADTLGSETERALTSYDDLYADSRKWLAEGWIDYLAPQLYYSTLHKRVNYNNLLNWYNQNSFGHHVYIGLAYYKAHEPDEEGWHDTKELPRQISLLRKKENIHGFSFFRASSFHVNPIRLEDTLRKMNNYYCVPPPMLWLDSVPTNAPQNLKIINTKEGVQLQWEAPFAALDGEIAHHYVVYRVKTGDTFDISSAKNIIGLPRKTTFLDNKFSRNTTYYYFITSADRLNNESSNFIGGSIKTN